MMTISLQYNVFIGSADDSNDNVARIKQEKVE